MSFAKLRSTSQRNCVNAGVCLPHPQAFSGIESGTSAYDGSADFFAASHFFHSVW